MRTTHPVTATLIDFFNHRISSLTSRCAEVCLLHIVFLRRNHAKELTAPRQHPSCFTALLCFVSFCSHQTLVSVVQTQIVRALARQLTVTHTAGDPGVFAETCSGICYNDYVIGSPSNYDNAYFEVRSVRVFGTSPAVDIFQSSNSASGNGKSALKLAGLMITMLALLMAL